MYRYHYFLIIIIIIIVFKTNMLKESLKQYITARSREN